MPCRWSWDFEDDPQPKPAAPPLPSRSAEPGADEPSGPSGPTRREALIRRRRALALVGGLVLLVIVIAAASAGSHHTPSPAHTKVKARAASRPPTDPEQEEMT